MNTIKGKGGQLKIDVASDVIRLHGQASESAGQLLQGVLRLELTETMKVRSVLLKFSGKMKVSWSEGNTYITYI